MEIFGWGTLASLFIEPHLIVLVYRYCSIETIGKSICFLLFYLWFVAFFSLIFVFKNFPFSVIKWLNLEMFKRLKWPLKSLDSKMHCKSNIQVFRNKMNHFAHWGIRFLFCCEWIRYFGDFYKIKAMNLYSFSMRSITAS